MNGNGELTGTETLFFT